MTITSFLIGNSESLFFKNSPPIDNKRTMEPLTTSISNISYESLELILEYLSVKDLMNMEGTCKQMRQEIYSTYAYGKKLKRIMPERARWQLNKDFLTKNYIYLKGLCLWEESLRQTRCHHIYLARGK